MDLPTFLVVAFAIASLVWLWHTHRGDVVGSLRVPNRRDVWLGSPRHVTLTVRRIAGRNTVRVALVMRVGTHFRGGPMSLEHAARCAELLERCAAEGASPRMPLPPLQAPSRSLPNTIQARADRSRWALASPIRGFARCLPRTRPGRSRAGCAPRHARRRSEDDEGGRQHRGRRQDRRAEVQADDRRIVVGGARGDIDAHAGRAPEEDVAERHGLRGRGHGLRGHLVLLVRARDVEVAVRTVPPAR